MDTKTLDLRGLGDAERDTKVNQAIAILDGWKRHDENSPWGWTKPSGQQEMLGYEKPYASSVNEIVPLIEKWRSMEPPYRQCSFHLSFSSKWFVDMRGGINGTAQGNEKSLALAACYALLRANGIEVLA